MQSKEEQFAEFEGQLLQHNFVHSEDTLNEELRWLRRWAPGTISRSLPRFEQLVNMDLILAIFNRNEAVNIHFQDKMKQLLGHSIRFAYQM